MPRKLADSTVGRLRVQLEAERTRLVKLLETHQREREEARLSETAAERTPDPMTAEGGSMAFEYEKELSVDQNLEDLGQEDRCRHEQEWTPERTAYAPAAVSTSPSNVSKRCCMSQNV